MSLRLAAVVVLMIGCVAPVSAASLGKQAKIYSPLRDAPPWNGNPAYPAESYFGSSIHVSGATAAITEREPFGEQLIRMFERDAAGQWNLQQTILPPTDAAVTASMKTSFGTYAALDGNRLVVVLRNYPQPCLVLIYEKIAGVWQEASRIPAQPYFQLNGSFGEGGAALSGDTLAIGSPGNVQGAYGAVHVFVHQGGTWGLQQVVSENDPYPAAKFGNAIQLQGDRLVVNRPGAHFEQYTTSGVYVFDRSAGVWNQQAKITQPPPAQPGGFIVGYFGHSFALDGDRLSIPDQEMRNVNGAGFSFDVVRVYQRNGGGQWPLTASLDTGAIHQGNPSPTLSVAMRGERLLVGQTYLQNDLYAGTVPKIYLFEHGGSGWSGAQALSPYDWEDGWVDGADIKFRLGAGFGDNTNNVGGIAFDDTGSALIAALLDKLVVPLQMNSNPPGAVYVLTDSVGLFCNGFEDNDPARCESMRQY
ncbi:MAG: hypothetical protein LKM32_09030 [Chiayiivirga sp.]|jgi:hypothetical protein|uniref:hypothetical protein n=1 Tax=Chiayiivirga sp. TaxID=2041042 RepID=UPI0025C39A59|nr:hypothetical protein [Chiayiivirga sp.]MCI1711916.1 hypothetical protein [Chiayiivirga sp.]MCI1729497.1 hypothetical protein [Chiayiivirga sp.]